MKKLIVFMFSVLLLGSCNKEQLAENSIKEIEGCTDIYSTNYNSEATVDDGSCSDNRTIKFSVERTSSEPQFDPSSNNGGSCGVRLKFTYSGGAGVSQVNGDAIASWNHTNWSGLSLSQTNNTYDETDVVTMIKNDNVSLQIEWVSINTTYTGTYDIKAHIGSNEIIILEENYSPQAVHYAAWPCSGGYNINWILP